MRVRAPAAQNPDPEDLQINIINVAVRLDQADISDVATLQLLSETLVPFRDRMHGIQVRRITFLIVQDKTYPK